MTEAVARGLRPQRVLVAEDDPRAAKPLVDHIVSTGLDATWAPDGKVALEHLRSAHHDVLVTDLEMPEVGGIELIRRVHADQPRLVIVVTTAFATVSTAVEALRLGALDYLPKPFSFSHFDAVLDRAWRSRAPDSDMETSIAPARLGISSKRPLESAEMFTGNSPAMRAILETADRIAPTETVVLIRGETGTGKELLARRIHVRSKRAQRAFVRFNCGNLSSTLADAQLFGSERGAFTNAVRQTIGVIESATGGTVFLDEIGELQPELQVKLLDFLQDRTFRRLGSSAVHRADVRILLATHRDLEGLVHGTAFRADFYYRLRQVELRLPALRERSEDIPALAAYLMIRNGGHPAPELSPGAMRLACTYPWPGNIRELEQALIAATAFAPGPRIEECDLRRALGLVENSTVVAVAPVTHPDSTPAADASWEVVQRWHILRALEALGGNVSAVARRLGIDRSTIYRKLNDRD